MNGKKARALRQAEPARFTVKQGDALIRDKRAADTLDRAQTLALEKADDKAAGKLSPARHLLSRLNYKKVSR